MYRFSLQEKVEQLGYHYITEAIVKLYRKHQSGYKVAALLGLTAPTIMGLITRIGEPKNLPGRRPRGI